MANINIDFTPGCDCCTLEGIDLTINGVELHLTLVEAIELQSQLNQVIDEHWPDIERR